MITIVELHIGRVVLEDVAKRFLESNPLLRINMHCIHGKNLFNSCDDCSEHFSKRARLENA